MNGGIVGSAIFEALDTPNRLRPDERCHMRLSDLKVRNEKPGSKARKVFDGLGLYLLIQPSGKAGGSGASSITVGLASQASETTTSLRMIIAPFGEVHSTT